MSRSTKRGRRSPARWQRLIAEQAESGLAQAAFCRARGLSVSSFGYWKRKLAAQTPVKVEAAAADFVELTADVADPPFAYREDWDIELALGAGLVLRLRRR